jgi:outer membrane immunogenic protein
MSMLLRLFVGILATAAVTGMARAADLPLPTKAPPAPLYDWTGFYVGGNVGYGSGHTDVTGSSSSVLLGVATPSTFAGGLNSSGVLGGGQIGFNYQFAPYWVAGIEADIDGAGINGSTNTCSATTAGVAVGCDTAALKLTDFGTVRGRLGYAWNNMLLFGTGGFAWGQNSTTHTGTCVGPGCPAASLPFASNSPTTSTTFPGWAAGAGAEWGFLPNWTLRLEYLHLGFNDVTTNYVFSGTVVGLPFTTATHTSANSGVDLVRLGVNYVFNWPPMR